MPSRYVNIQLQPGQAQGILPDHRKMLPGVVYTIDWDTFQKLSIGARQNVIQVVSIVGDNTSASTSFVPNQVSTGPNNTVNIQSVLSTTSTTPNTLNLAGFAAQGWSAGAAGPTGVGSNNVINFSLTGPAGERYTYVQTVSGVAAGAVCVWYDEVNRLATGARPTFTVFQDGQGSDFVATVTVGTQVGTKQGRFAGVANVAIASGYYGWVQTEGFCPALQVTGTVAAGATLAVSTTVSGAATTQSATTRTVGANNVVTGSPLANNVFGTAVTSGTNTTIQAHLRSVNNKPKYIRTLNKN